MIRADLPGSVEQMERYFQDSRFVGVKLYCPFGGNMATKRMQDLLDEVARFGRPGQNPHGRRRFTIRRRALSRAAQPQPCNHQGPTAMMWRARARSSICPNVYFEFCSSGINAGTIRRSLDILGPERILFGTDQPLFAPWFEYGAYVDAIQTQREADLIFRENARRIFDL